MSGSAATVLHLLTAGADSATCINTPGGKPLTYSALRALTAQTIDALNTQGVGRNDRVAIVLDNGPEMAVAFLSIAAGATAAPLNPAYRSEEFEFYLSDLKAKILVIGHDKSSPPLEVHQKLAIPVARLTATPEHGAGSFALAFPDVRPAAPAERSAPAAPDDI